MQNDVVDLRHTIVPKSDQLNSEQLMTGAITILVTGVQLGNAEQPVVVHYEGDDGRPFKPCKTMRKVLILAWGEDGNKWIGQSMTLFNDPAVRFGNAEVGGIRISHMTGIAKDIHVQLTATKGKKAPHTIKRLELDAGPTLASVLEVIPKVKGQKGKEAAEALIARLPFEDQLAATEALEKRVESLKSPATA